jgi:hypothetical protein
VVHPVQFQYGSQEGGYGGGGRTIPIEGGEGEDSRTHRLTGPIIHELDEEEQERHYSGAGAALKGRGRGHAQVQVLR